MSATRVYKLAPVLGNDDLPQLVEATSQSQAYSHMARKHWVASIAGQFDLVELIGQGVKVEKALKEIE
jgi:hypothetical protein